MLDGLLIAFGIGAGASIIILHTFGESKRNCGAMLSFYANLLADVRRNKAEQADGEVETNKPAN